MQPCALDTLDYSSRLSTPPTNLSENPKILPVLPRTIHATAVLRPKLGGVFYRPSDCTLWVRHLLGNNQLTGP